MSLSKMGNNETCELLDIAVSDISYNPKTGIFTRKKRSSRSRAGEECGSINSRGYYRVGVGGIKLPGHRLAYALHYGFWPTKQLDHVDGDKLNNKISNLRECTPEQNQINRVNLHPKNKSGVRGVFLRRSNNKWCAKISNKGASIWLGVFTDKQDAIDARKKAEIKYFGEFAPKMRIL